MLLLHGEWGGVVVGTWIRSLFPGKHREKESFFFDTAHFSCMAMLFFSFITGAFGVFALLKFFSLLGLTGFLDDAISPLRLRKEKSV